MAPLFVNTPSDGRPRCVELMASPSVVLLCSTRWEVQNGVAVRGQGVADGKRIGALELAKLVESVPPRAVGSLMGKLAGSFAVLDAREPGVVRLVSDMVSSMPVYYTLDGSRLTVSDDSVALAQETGCLSEIDSQASLAMLLAGFTLGTSTICRRVHCLQAAECVVLTCKGSYWASTQDDLFSWEWRPDGGHTDDYWFSAWSEVLNDEFEDIITELDGRTAVIPLSGGHDSTLILLMLKRLGYEKVVAFSYGRRGNQDSTVSERVAAALRVPWFFVEYGTETWRQFLSSRDYNNYATWAGGLRSIAHVGDFVAVRELASGGRIDAGSVLIPGHTMDLVSGGHIPLQWQERLMTGSGSVTADDIAQITFERHMGLWNRRFAIATLHQTGLQVAEANDLFEQLQEELCPAGGVVDVVEACSVVDAFDWRNRQGKFIANSVRVYDWFGFDWLLPYWDRRIIDFWLRVPPELRLNRRLQKNVTFQIGADLGIDLHQLGLPSVASLARNMSGLRLRQIGRVVPGVRLILDVERKRRCIARDPLGAFEGWPDARERRLLWQNSPSPTINSLASLHASRLLQNGGKA
ncbi:asparagine synthase C-terminal domain-containing protein [Candidatus Cryosericum hinesii]|jgi:asparagine synthase (glutamine-hydrolysing)|nr:asparagine synthase C-terminal domain-containing protein [Candidatus Cryosericum hinesii]